MKHGQHLYLIPFNYILTFSGYTDMAIGIALLFNIKTSYKFLILHIKALSIQDFLEKMAYLHYLDFLEIMYIYLLEEIEYHLLEHIQNLMATFIIGWIMAWSRMDLCILGIFCMDLHFVSIEYGKYLI